ncbi:iron-containing redox enzyme family protein [Actinocrinis puniceicyclus]|uniref:Iron-containing redox enzyme family protein n=1 Tax=Actinocrinis puniceicyclus TaxID=977794 RepID=A0A8J7WIQ5_9ACTN|nr:iron-containing redox enzyme family protein [Actinocrinis puniceicyclus]MBS2962951.1 iron-containing redox enzyme family protein [Actinocrinis puniceicyclus]
MRADDALTAPGTHTDPRELYAAALDPEGGFSAAQFAEALRAEFDRAAGAAPVDIDAGVRAAARWAAAATARVVELGEKAADADRPVLARRAALGCAPLALVSGAWLQWLSSPADADEPEVLSALALYADDVGVGHPRSSRGDAYLDVLRALRLAESAVPTARLARDRRVPGWAFRLPAVLLAAGRRPERLRSEILGADLCLRAAGLLPPLALVRAAQPHAADWNALDPATARKLSPGGLDAARRCVQMRIERGGPQARARVLRGLGWALAALGEWQERMVADLDAALDPGYEMAQLLRDRAREGSVYHQRFELGGRPLSCWLAESREDPAGLLAALSESRLVKPGAAEASSLVNALVSERGPMFRVFSPEDLDVVRRWIDGLPGTAAAHARSAARAKSEQTPLAIPLPSPEEEVQDGGRVRVSLREAYHGLINRNSTPRLRRFAVDYVHGWLARARTGLDVGETKLPAAWEPGGLRPWLLEQHDAHGQYFERTAEEPIPSREDLIDSTVQLAPLTLIDGGWLHGFTDYEHATSELGSFLFETYWDELGNGEPKLNHPLIYRQVLAQMGVELAPTGAAGFAADPRLRESSFELPVYWLSIGRFPQRFLPEILGLNLAMELSGVGGSYRRAHLALTKYGFSTRFVDIHNTIDNVAAGHSAWAADAVDTHMSAVLLTRGAAARAEVWDRVRAGFRSLDPPADRRARRAQRAAARAGSAR